MSVVGHLRRGRGRHYTRSHRAPPLSFVRSMRRDRLSAHNTQHKKHRSLRSGVMVCRYAAPLHGARQAIQTVLAGDAQASSSSPSLCCACHVLLSARHRRTRALWRPETDYPSAAHPSTVVAPRHRISTTSRPQAICGSLTLPRGTHQRSRGSHSGCPTAPSVRRPGRSRAAFQGGWTRFRWRLRGGRIPLRQP